MSLIILHNQLSVRQFVASDKDDFIHIVQHPYCMKYSMTGKLSESQAVTCFEKLMNNKKHKMYAIEDTEKGGLIGCTGLQDCYIDDEIESSFILRLLPEIYQHPDLLPLLTLLVKELLSVYELQQLQVIVAKNNQFTAQLITELNFEKIKSTTCRGIHSDLYQFK